MTPRVRRLLLAASLSALASGCAHRPLAPTSLTPDAPTPRGETTAFQKSTAAAGRMTEPGATYTRLFPRSPFAPRLVATTQVAHEDIFLHRSGGAAPDYPSTTRLHRGQRVFFLPFATNYGITPDRRTDLTYELSIHRPDGSADGESFSAVLWQNVVGGPNLVLYPAMTVSFHAEPRDPLGDYRVTLRATDHLAGETRELTHVFTVVDYVPPEPPPGLDARRWLSAYHENPTPELALPLLPALYTALPADQRASALPPLLGFYDQVLADNPWLLRAFCTRLASARPDDAYALSLVLGHHLRDAETAPEGVDFATWVRLEDFRAYAWPSDPDRALVNAAQLDTLWGRFFASGLYEPVARVLAPLSDVGDLGAAERWQKLRLDAGESPDLSPDALLEPGTDDASPSTPPPEVRRDILLRTALWSLRNNAAQHALVRLYLDWTLLLGDLPPPQKNLLARVLRPDAQAAAATAAAPRNP